MSYKILSKRNSLYERSVTFETDGNIQTISAPSINATFEDLVAKIEAQYGDSKKKPSGTEQEKANPIKATVKAKKKNDSDVKDDG